MGSAKMKQIARDVLAEKEKRDIDYELCALFRRGTPSPQSLAKIYFKVEMERDLRDHVIYEVGRLYLQDTVDVVIIWR